eukprot:COSAG05_NODE_226_length_13453_cov_12.522315_16_plen_56_part_01
MTGKFHSHDGGEVHAHNTDVCARCMECDNCRRVFAWSQFALGATSVLYTAYDAVGY